MSGSNSGSTANFWGNRSPYEQASVAQNNALATTQGALNANARAAFNSYNPAMAGAAGYGVAKMNAAGYNADANRTHARYNAAVQGGPNTIASQMGRYQNPYEDQVVQSAMEQANIDRQRAMEQNRAAAAAAGAFGGGRHGLTEAATNAEINRNLTNDVAALRQQGFNTAAGLAGQDVGNQMNVAAANQAARNSQRSFNAANAQQMRLANQAAMNAQRQFNAANAQQARSSNQAATNAARAFNAQNKQQTNLSNQAARNAARQFNAQGQNQFDQQQYTNAMQGAAQMAGLGSQSFGYGNTLNGNLMTQGQIGQDIQNALIGQAAGMFDSYTGQPSDILSMRLASLGVNPLTKTGTQTGTATRNPGMMDYLGLAAGVGGSALGGK